MSDKIYNTSVPSQFTLPLAIPEQAKVWRPIHYLGSKLRLADSIRILLADLDPTLGTACDLFAGSGTVSLAVSADRCVIAADIQEYSGVLCAALLQPASLEKPILECIFQDIAFFRKQLEISLEPILDFEQQAMECAYTNPAPLCDLIEHGSLLSINDSSDALALAVKETNSRIDKHSFVPMATRYFGGTYFSYRQTLYIDCVLAVINELPTALKDTCLAALLSTASSIVNSIGKQFAQPIRPRRADGTIKQSLISQISRDRSQKPEDVFFFWLSKYCNIPKSNLHEVIRGDYREVLSQICNVSVIYADPPYTRDHYSRFYHVLETLCLQDFPDISTTSLKGNASRGLYRKDRHQSPFCIKSQAPQAFKDLFSGSKKHGVPLLLSYSPFVKDGHPRLMTVEAVAKIASEYYSFVEIKSAGQIAHSKLNKTEFHLASSDIAEVFIICRD